MHCLAADCENEPAAQSVQLVEEEIGAYLPGSQEVHDKELLVAEKEPAAQGLQDVWAVVKPIVPASHKVQAVLPVVAA